MPHYTESLPKSLTLLKALTLTAIISFLGGEFVSAAPPAKTPLNVKNGVRPFYKLYNPKGVTSNTAFYTWSIKNLCKAYGLPTGLSNSNGVIGILEFGGGWTQADLDLFSANNGLPKINVTNVSLDGTQNSPGTYNNPNGADYEVNLDIQMAAATYYYCTGKMPTIYVFYSTPNDYGGAKYNSAQAFIATMNAALQYKCDVLSISWGAPEIYFRYWDPKFPAEIQSIESAAIQTEAAGTTIFAAAGDYGSGDRASNLQRLNVDVPAACPHVVACGGTTKTPSSETVWGGAGYYYFYYYYKGKKYTYIQNFPGTGGGYSTVFPVQSWQKGIPATATGRMVPDMSADADSNTGVQIVVYGYTTQIGGTSGVSPFYSGLYAALAKKPGWVAPVAFNNQNVFVDITQGTNGFYTASKGPDPCTGVGVPNGHQLGKLYGYAYNPQSSASFNNSTGTLTINGDATNGISITATYTPTKVSGQIVGATVTLTSPDGSTPINGASSATFNVGAQRFAVVVNTGGGSDTITLNSFLSNTVTVNMGNGGDTLNLNYCSISNSLVVDGGTGIDAVNAVGCSIAKQTMVNVP